jgi:hypothetical protein
MMGNKKFFIRCLKSQKVQSDGCKESNTSDVIPLFHTYLPASFCGVLLFEIHDLGLKLSNTKKK